MLRIAFFAPLTPVRSALADHVEGLLPSLLKHLDITIVTSGTYKPSHPMFNEGSQPRIPCISYKEFLSAPDEYDLVVYELGDEPEIHGYMFEALKKHPGLILLNDLVLHHAIVGMTLGKRQPERYIEEMRYSYGQLGENLAKRVMAGQADELMWRYPLVERVLDQSLAVVAFNDYMADKVHKLRPELPTREIPYPYYMPEKFPDDFNGKMLRRDLGLENRPIVASFGFFIPDKRLNLAINAFRQVLEVYPNACYLLVGGSSPHYNLEAQLQTEGLSDNIWLTGWQDQVSFVKYMHITDVAVHLRWPHIGGTPYTPIRLLGLGVPTIISDIEPLAEIPKDAVIRVPPNHLDEEELLAKAISNLLSRPDEALSMGKRGQIYIQENHSLEHIVAEYLDFFQWVAENKEMLLAQVGTRKQMAERPEPCPGYDRVIGILGEAMAGMGLSAEDDLWLDTLAITVDTLLAPWEDR